MKRACLALAVSALSGLLSFATAAAQSCSIGGHNETSENFAAGSWSTVNMTPGTAPPITAIHLLISEVAPRGAGTGVASDSSEYVEIHNPTSRPVSLDDKYLSDDTNYYRVVNGTYNVVQPTDFAVRFPQGLVLSPGRTAVVCVTKQGFAGSGASAAGAEHFLEMRDTNGNTADDMVLLTPNSSFPATGGNFTNPSSTNGEWIVLFCWNGVSDLVCDLDYASWGANSASNPKLDKSGVAFDGPDAGTSASTFNNDTPAGVQLNLGTAALVKPNTYQRTGSGEPGEVETNGNGCIGRAIPTVIDWLPAAGTSEPTIRFHVRWENPDEDLPSAPISGSMSSQEFGVFLPNHGPIGGFDVPPLQPDSFFDVFIEIPLASLPAPPEKRVPGQGPVAARAGGPTLNVACPPDTNWAGNVDVQWTANSQTGQVNVHYSDLLTCPGGDPSFIHVRPSNCPTPMPWSVTGLCPGFTATLVNEDFSPAPNPIPVGWSGWIQVVADGSVASGTSCCFELLFGCGNASSSINICSTACDCETAAPNPVLNDVTWTLDGTTVTFVQHWTNPSTVPSGPVSGDMSSQELGVFLPNYGPIGPFTVPPIAPNSFFDVFIDIDLSQLPPEPEMELPPGLAGAQCFPAQWHGNVDLIWAGAGGTGQANYHFDEVPVCPGASPTYVHVETGCVAPTGATWTVTGLCPGFTATLVNLDHTPAPNPLPANWIGLVAVQAPAGTPIGVTCCFTIEFTCGTEVGVIKVCAKTCQCRPRQPVLADIDWIRLNDVVRFHLQWTNPDPSGPSEPVSGHMSSQEFGLFLPPWGPIGPFDVPPIEHGSFFDVFLEVPLSELPPEPEEVLPGGGPGPGSPCPPENSWAGNVDIMWSGVSGEGGNVNYHFTNLLVRPGNVPSRVHALIFCNSSAGASWSIAGLCPGWSAVLLNEDLTPAPNPVPANWTGWIAVTANAGVPAGQTCCFSLTFVCDGEAGTIDVCATTCVYENTGVGDGGATAEFGILRTAPNPVRSELVVDFAAPKSGRASVEIYDLGGKRVSTLFDGVLESGTHSVRWNGRDASGRRLAPGAYFLKLRSGALVTSRKVVLIH